MAQPTTRAHCTCGHCARCTKILRAAIRREGAAPAQRAGTGPVAWPAILGRLAVSRGSGWAAVAAASPTTGAHATDPTTTGSTVDTTPETQQRDVAA